MFEVIPISFTRTGFPLSKTRYFEKSSPNPRPTLFKSSKIGKNLTDTNEHMKPKNPYQKKQRKTESTPRSKNVFMTKRKITATRVYELYLNIEKKQISERSTENDKRSALKTALKVYSPFKTLYTKKLTPDFDVPSPEIKQPKPSAFETWKLSQKVDSNSKVFIISGTYPDIRNSLFKRGWVENCDTESPNFDLKWARNARVPSNMQDWQIINHFPRNYELSVKWQLYENIKQVNRDVKYSFLQFMPRCFRLDAKGTEDFLDCFKAIYAVSLLKRFIETGSELVEQVLVCGIICKRWINDVEKCLLGEERSSTLVMNIEWKLLTSSDLSEIKNLFQRMMLSYHVDAVTTSKHILRRIEEIDPQFFINGSQNIWIVKAGRKSRGRDISLFSDLEDMKTKTASNNSWVVQKYIENPLLIQDRKFDIRQWVLVSSSEPLTIWVYKKCYLRFSIEKYDSENIKNPFIHLTNNSISKKSKNFESSDIEGCMWSIEDFKRFLEKEMGQDLWSTQVYPKIKKIIKHSLLAVGNLGRKNSFEIFGYDFMIDNTLTPWLLEVNSSPAMDYSTTITECLVKEVLEDSIKVIVDFPQGSQDTGNFELYYRGKNQLSFRKTF